MSAPAPVISAELKTVLRPSSSAAASAPSPNVSPWPTHAAWDTPISSSWSWPDEVTRRETSSADLGPRRGARPRHGARKLGRGDQGQLRPRCLGRAVLVALRRRRAQRDDHGTRRRRQDLMASALGHAAVRCRRSVVFCRADMLLKRLRASQLDNSHDAEMRKLMRRPPDPRRLRPPGARHPRHRRHLGAGRRASPGRLDAGDFQPRAHRVDRPDGRCPLGPVRHRPSPVGGLRARLRRRVLPQAPKVWARRRHDDPAGYSSAKEVLTLLTQPSSSACRRCKHWK